MLIKVPYIGMVDHVSIEQYYEAIFELNGKTVQLDINFESTSLELNKIEEVKHFIENIRIHDLSNKKCIKSDFNDGGEVLTYIEHHISELATDDLLSLVGKTLKRTEHPKQLLLALHLIRVGIYPEDSEVYAVFDYSIGKELTDYVLVVNTDKNGNLEFIDMES